MSAVTVATINAMVDHEFPSSTGSCSEIGDGYAVARTPVDDSGLRPGAFVSGPTQFALLDAAFWYATFVGIGRIEPMAMTAELSVRYLRPASGSELFCRADIEAVSRRSVVMTGRVWCDDRADKITATAQCTYALPLPR